jgi:hypothetical protein
MNKYRVAVSAAVGPRQMGARRVCKFAATVVQEEMCNLEGPETLFLVQAGQPRHRAQLRILPGHV